MTTAHPHTPFQSECPPPPPGPCATDHSIGLPELRHCKRHFQTDPDVKFQKPNYCCAAPDGWKFVELKKTGINDSKFRCQGPGLSTTGYTRKSGIIILLYFVLTSPHSSITALLVNLGRSFSFRSTAISYTNFVSLVPSEKRCYVGRNDCY